MMQPILLLGDPRLYENSSPVSQEDLPGLRRTVKDLHDTLMAFREKYHAGRAIAAPQIGVPKRLIYMYIDRPVVFLNPTLEFPDPERMELLDDCMSFPGLLVKVERYRRCTVRCRDLDWRECRFTFEDDLSELIQHEYDHLDGILATMRAVDKRSLFFKPTDRKSVV